MSSLNIQKLPVELFLACLDFMDHVSVSRLSRTCKGLYNFLKLTSQQLAREYALLPAERALRCPETEETFRGHGNFPSLPKSNIEIAIIENRLGPLRAFLNVGTDPNAMGTGGVRLLGTAIWNDRVDAINILLEYKVDLSLELRDWPYTGLQYMRPTPVVYATASEWCSHITFQRDNFHIYGCIPEELETLSLLLRAGCPLQHVYDLTAIAARSDKLELLEYWLGNEFKIDKGLGARLTILDWWDAVAMKRFYLDYEVFEDGIDFLNTLLERYPELLSRFDPHEGSLVFCAIRKRAWKLVEVLLEHGAEVGLRTSGGDSELDFLAQRVSFHRLRPSTSLDGRHLYEQGTEWLTLAPLLEMRLQLIYYNF
ncbi:uncharacterized protein LDX57_000131 [Aspergillus melleus]|uniref:uncharacterized protein n=1 Tax=Aspergillus melleus TaxID=138277 RepID=UPI001E8D237B|nr:uncharacterized protein LDX57_000131 [Aspergillus melleus]KAH8422375.1 hypothetical protein LDX57_000131 [Aspergillus melleus]